METKIEPGKSLTSRSVVRTVRASRRCGPARKLEIARSLLPAERLLRSPEGECLSCEYEIKPKPSGAFAVQGY